MKILLVDDDTVARTILSELLQRQGHEVVEATDGQLAWDLVKQGAINFVLSDWLMPNLAGVDLCRKIRGDEPRSLRLCNSLYLERSQIRSYRGHGRGCR